MSCPPSDDLVSYIEGELPLNQHRELEQHATGCARCRGEIDELRRIISRIGAEEGEWDGVDLLAGVERAIDDGDELTARRARRRRWLLIAAPALAAAALLLLVALPVLRTGSGGGGGGVGGVGGIGGSGHSGFQARGGSDASLARWVRLWIYRRTKAGYEKIDTQVRADARLVFGYRNASPKLRYVMIVAVGAGTRLHWYYPADADKSPAKTSVAIKQGKHELPDEIVHPLGEGALTIYALFSAEPLEAAKVARALSRARGAELQLDGVAQVVRRLRVSKSP
ncbi:MAG: zf-HC2 domain-containing protein [Myxococcales bacterium]|nr:zf-HC2 domain-containing protein [Myxococcales bacterium]